MKKGDVIQLVIIIMALITGLNSLEYLIGSIISIVYALGAGEFLMPDYSPAIISILVTLLYVAICWLLLTKSRNIADFIYEKTNIGTSFKVVSTPGNLLYILLIVTGFYFLMQHLPVIVKGLVNAFKTKAVSKFDVVQEENPVDWTAACIRLLLPIILLMAARPIADYFAKNISDEPILIGDDVDNTENEITEN